MKCKIICTFSTDTENERRKRSIIQRRIDRSRLVKTKKKTRVEGKKKTHFVPNEMEIIPTKEKTTKKKIRFIQSDVNYSPNRKTASPFAPLLHKGT